VLPHNWATQADCLPDEGIQAHLSRLDLIQRLLQRAVVPDRRSPRDGIDQRERRVRGADVRPFLST